ncbi:hypothetical protein [Streptomyces sp. NPDC002952]|uniref:DUF7426 family protein n=1 Tax=Streptomyces sp. NPDC002952 TaxID=3364673 RepID=UPI0036B5E5FF
MAEEFKPLTRFLDDALVLPVPCRDGTERKFRIPSPPAEDGLRVDLLTMAAARLAVGGAADDEEVLNDEEEKNIFRLSLGEMHDEILHHVDWTLFKHVAMTAMVWITSDRDRAEQYWNSAGDPSLLAPNRAARRSQSSASSESAAANTTRSRGSTSGTRAGSPRNGKGRARGRR